MKKGFWPSTSHSSWEEGRTCNKEKKNIERDRKRGEGKHVGLVVEEDGILL